MEDEKEVLAASIEETQHDLNANILFLEAKIKERMNSAKRAVSDAIHEIKGEAERLSPVYQTKLHPFVGVGTAFVTGVVLSNLVTKRQGPVENFMPSRSGYGETKVSHSILRIFTPLQQALAPEVEIAKSLALNSVLSMAGKVLSKAAPPIAGQVAELVQRVQDRLQNKEPSLE